MSLLYVSFVCVFCRSLFQVSFAGLFCWSLLLISSDLYTSFLTYESYLSALGIGSYNPPPPDASDVPIDTVELARMRLARLEQAAPQSEALLGEKRVGAGGTDVLDSVMQVT